MKFYEPSASFSRGNPGSGSATISGRKQTQWRLTQLWRKCPTRSRNFFAPPSLHEVVASPATSYASLGRPGPAPQTSAEKPSEFAVRRTGLIDGHRTCVGGRELGLRKETLDLLAAPAIPPARGFYDQCLKAEVQFSLGFMKPSAVWSFGSASASSFGSPGSGGSLGFADPVRSEEHTSELQSLAYLVCRLLLEKKKST